MKILTHSEIKNVNEKIKNHDKVSLSTYMITILYGFS